MQEITVRELKLSHPTYKLGHVELQHSIVIVRLAFWGEHINTEPQKRCINLHLTYKVISFSLTLLAE